MRETIRLILLSVILMVFFPGASAAQNRIESNEIISAVGVNIPMYKNVGDDVLTSVYYGYYYPNGIGFRIGIQYSPSVADVNNYFGMPMAFTFRTRTRPAGKRVESATVGAFESAAYSDNEVVKYSIGSFLMNLFDRIEFSAGITPGYVLGDSSAPRESYWGEGFDHWKKTWTEKRHEVALSVDAGIGLNYSIWRFDIKLMPEFHYNLINNYRLHIESGNESTGEITYNIRPVRWFFSFCGGLAYRF